MKQKIELFFGIILELGITEFLMGELVNPTIDIFWVMGPGYNS